MSFFDRFRRRAASEESAHSAQNVGDTDREFVEGERSVSAVQRPPSLQSRLSNLLALALMGSLGVGLLGWYYAHSLGNRSAARVAAQSSAKEKAKGDVSFRPLGRVDPPPTVPSTPQKSALQGLLGSPPAEPPAESASAEARLPTQPAPAGSMSPAAYGVKTPRELQLERELAGPAFSAGTVRVGNSSEGEGVRGGAPGAAGGDLDTLLHPSTTPAVAAQMLPTQRLLLPKGAFLDCTLETAIDSTLAGMTTCILATDTFSADGSVVLLERGTKLVGETRGQARQGSTRVFVLWTEARTPTGVIVPLASPGTDELGRSGLPGLVNRHFFERFGAAMLISVIDGAIQAKIQSQGSGTVIYNPTASQDILTDVLRSTVNIPPTVVKPQGDRIQVLVARDLDFRSVYELRPASGH